MPETNRIQINPNVMMGKPVIRGTGIPVKLILRKLCDGMAEKELIEACPYIVSEDIRAAVNYDVGQLSRQY